MGEARAAFYILAASLPIVLATNGLRAVLEGCQRFDISNLLRAPSSILAFVIPAVGVGSGLQLPGIVLWLGISRLVFVFAHAFYCFQVLPCLRARPAVRSRVVFHLLSFGGWVTLSNVVNPILLSMDRFFIGSLLSVALVGYYTAPFEAVTKLWVIPASLMTAVYPACSALGAEHMRDVQILYSRSIKYIFCTLAPVSVLLVLFARPVIGVWLGPGFVDKSAVALQLLAVGVFFNCFAHVPYSFLQALGRPEAAAKLFLLELVPYAGLALWMVGRYGIAGASFGWALRAIIEVLLLLWIAQRLLSLSATHVLDRSMRTALAALLAAGVAAYVTNLFLRDAIWVDASLCALWMAGFALAVWKWVLDAADRSSALAAMGPLRGMFRKSFRSAGAN
jgi:O-antigen/teichoic acid export membrane protein